MRANRFAQVFSFVVMSVIKVLTHIFYRFEVKWLSGKQIKQLDDVKLVVLLNHTSLYEALFVRLAPFSFLWKIARNMLVPVADVTTKRPLVGMFFHALVPGVVPISRKRDASWNHFLTQIKDDAIVAILPEGRMRRHNGFDKHGKPMSVRAGVADIIEQIDSGDILFVYSGGLHHIQVPGQAIPKLFKTIKTHMELVSVDDYKDALYHPEVRNRKTAFVRDIQKRLDELTPYCEQQPYNKEKQK